MDFLLSDDLKNFSDVFKKFFATSIGPSVLRQELVTAEKRHPRDIDETQKALWQKLAGLGVFSAPLPEAQGGLGMGLISAYLALEESGYFLCPLPLFETLAFGIAPLSLIGNEQAQETLLPLVSEGSLIVTSSVAQISRLAIDAELKDDPKNLLLVPSLFWAKKVLFFRKEKKAISMAMTNSLLPVEKVEIVSTYDLVRHFVNLNIRDEQYDTVSPALSAESLFFLSRLISVFAVAEMLGAARRALDMTLEHVKTRQQFGRAIGSFQAVQHKLADMHLQIEQAAALGRFAAWCADNDKEQFDAAALAAKGFASEVLPLAIEQAIQAHGGIGFTYEYDLHLYLRRALMWASLLGASEDCYRMLGELSV